MRHVSVDDDLVTPMGKVGGVLTGLRHASCELAIIADDDVRYDDDALRAVLERLSNSDVVRPQNYFDPLPWHAAWDTGRILINRALSGDWPGTLGVRRSRVMAAGGYAGDVMFENLEMVRTVVRAGGKESVALDIFVRRKPPTTSHFFKQRVRQAYDEFARPWRLLSSLMILPLLAVLIISRLWKVLSIVVGLTVLFAEFGRRRAGGRSLFPLWTSLMAPPWIVERSVTSWLAVHARLRGGIPYGEVRLKRAASPAYSLSPFPKRGEHCRESDHGSAEKCTVVSPG